MPNNDKKTLLITYYFPPQIGGGESYLYNIYKRLPAEKVVVLTNNTHEQRQVSFDSRENFKIYREIFFESRLKPRWWPLIKKVKRIILKENINVIHFGQYVHYILLATILKMPYIVYIQGSSLSNYTKSLFGKKLAYYNLKKADTIIATSNFLKNKVIKLGIEKEKIKVVHPGINLDEFDFQIDKTPLPPAQNTQDKKIILSVGHLIKLKGYDLAIKALKDIQKEIPNILYIIIGGGEEKENLKKLAQELNLEDKVIFTGEIKDKKELSKYYQAADIFAGPSRSEGFGIVFLEARAFGLPIVASDVGGVKEAAGVKGLLIRPEDSECLAENIIKILKTGIKFEPEKGFGWGHRAKELKKIFNLQGSIEEKPFFSIIIPTYNSASTLKNCLDHIINQTIIKEKKGKTEILVVNDGSKDNTKEILNDLEKKYPITVIHQENSGAPAARNHGFRKSRGQYLIFVDSDIHLKPTCLEKMYQTLKDNPNAAYAYASFRWGFKKFKLWKFDSERLKKMPYIPTCSLIKREYFPGFDENLKRFQDWDLWLTILENGREGIWIPKILFTTPILTDRNTISSWIPSFVHKYCPWLVKSRIKEYDNAKQIILEKHHLV
ncbi:glycosyltransferase [Candidatus Falkowbacteria bacterium]|nr:glycosyltransferase [Candidatus Falkowbacteria bacterium]